MSWRTPTGPLAHEHRVIERMIALMRERLERIEGGGGVDPGFILAATDFIHTYADRCHHGKEEDILFRRLAEKELPRALAEAMQDLIEDHRRSRALTARLVEANAAYAGGDATALGEIEAAMRGLVELYPVHIDKEDHHFFRECLAYLSKEEQSAMLAEYAAFDAQLIHEKYLAAVEALERTPEGAPAA